MASSAAEIDPSRAAVGAAPTPPAPDAPQDAHDAYWLAHVYKPDEPQLTARAVIAGMLLGGVMSVSNLYIGMKIGWSLGMAITSTILAFASFKLAESLRVTKRGLSPLENNTVASAASAAGYFSSAGMVSAIPALYLTQQRTLNWWELAVWMFGVSIVGVFMAIPMRRQMIDIDRLPFPSGIACAETIRSMGESAGEAVKKARALLFAGVFAALVEIPAQIGAITRRTGEVLFKNPLTWGEHVHLPGALAGKSLLSYTLALPTSPLLYAAGALIGVRVAFSLAIGSLVLYLGLVPWLADHGIVVVTLDQPGLTYRSVLAWSVWPGVMAALAASLVQFAFKWRTVVQAFGSLGKLAKSGSGASAISAVEVPPAWFLWGMAGATVYVCLAGYAIFDIPVWMSVIAVALSFLLSIVACRATGETDVTPIGALGKITQLTFAGLHPGSYATNLMTASVTAGSASHSADLLTDLKTGHLLGGSPRRQFVAQMFGIVAGAIFCVPAYLLVAQPEKLGTAELPAPAAQTWAVVADLLARGVEQKERGEGTAVAAELEAVGISRRPPGTVAGDTLVVDEGPFAGSYRVSSVLRGALVLDRDLPALPENQAEGAPFPAHVRGADGTERGTTAVKRAVTRKPALRFVTPVAGTQVGDYALATVGGREVWHRVEAQRGDVASLDHAFAGGADATRISVSKRTLPPYAMTATAIGVAIGILLALIEMFAPASVRRFVPSISGIGISWVITGYDALAMAIGASIAWIFARVSAKNAEALTTPAASGILAGASLIGLLVIFLRDILKVLAGVE
jgi:uncharacterized oligopeptide transporter (OPT) family protein